MKCRRKILKINFKPAALFYKALVDAHKPLTEEELLQAALDLNIRLHKQFGVPIIITHNEVKKKC